MNNSSDTFISFDSDGNCNYCNEAILQMEYSYHPNNQGNEILEGILRKIKEDGANRKYDCLMGISGGLDSSYLALLGAKWGLKILAVHIDDGFDAPVAVDNINKLCKATNLDLQIISPDSKPFKCFHKYRKLEIEKNPLKTTLF